jgi:hypothetical protein
MTSALGPYHSLHTDGTVSLLLRRLSSISRT